MLSDFSAKAKEARFKIPVPDVPMERIVARSERRRTSKIRAIVIGSIMSVAMIGTAAAFGTRIYDGMRVWLSGNNGTIVIQSFAMVRDPKESDLKAVASKATFPIVLPVDLPPGTRVRSLIYAPMDHPNIVSIQYLNDRTKWHVGFTIVETAAIGAGPPPLPGMPVNAARWTVGRETVLAPRDILPADQLRHIRNAMTVTSSQDSQTATKALLYRATILGAARDLPRIALRYTPTSGNTVVLGPHFANAIPSLAKRGKPLIGSNTTYLTNIPSVHGEPDYAKATLHWPHTVAISPPGVRAVAATLRYARAAANCDCSIVVNSTDSSHYRVWVIHPGTAVKSYRVDAGTLAVTQTNR